MKLKITVHGVAYEVDVEVLDASDEMQGNPPPIPSAPSWPSPTGPTSGPPGGAPPPPIPGSPAAAAGAAGGIASPIAGTVLEVKCRVGDIVRQGQVLLVIEAMKMETAIAAPTAGTVKAIHAAAGDTVRENQVLVDFEDPAST